MGALVVDGTAVYWTNGSGASHQCKTIVKTELP
jgi:hypothetical protein